MRVAKSLLSLNPHGWRFYKPVGLTTTVTAPGLLVVLSSAGEGEAAVVADVPPTLLKGPLLPPAPAVPPTSPASASACTHEALLVRTSAVGKSLTQ